MGYVVGRALGFLATSLLAVGCCCGGPEVRHATLAQAAGLTEGARVMVSGVDVGEVQSVHVEGSDVDVAFTFDPDQHVTLRESACALPLSPRADAPTALVVMAGEGEPLPIDQPISQCHIPLDAIGDFVTSLGDGFASVRDAVVSFLRELAGASPSLPSPGTPGPDHPTDLPSTPLPLAPEATSLCAALHIVVERIEPAAAIPLILPSGGWRIHLGITNGGDTDLSLPEGSGASFVDRDQRAMAVLTVPGDDWFMPVPLPAHVTTPVTVVMSSDPSSLAELTIAGITTPSDPFGGCTVHQTFTPAAP